VAAAFKNCLLGRRLGIHTGRAAIFGDLEQISPYFSISPRPAALLVTSTIAEDLVRFAAAVAGTDETRGDRCGDIGLRR